MNRLKGMKQQMSTQKQTKMDRENETIKATNFFSCFLNQLKRSSQVLLTAANISSVSKKSDIALASLEKGMIEAMSLMVEAVSSSEKNNPNFDSPIANFLQCQQTYFSELSKSQAEHISALAQKITDKKLREKVDFLAEKNKFLVKDNLKKQAKIGQLDADLEKVKLNYSDSHKLKIKLEEKEKTLQNYQLRIYKLSEYSSSSIDNLLKTSPDELKYECLCGTSLFTDLQKILLKKREELEKYKPESSKKTAQFNPKHDSDKMQEENSDTIDPKVVEKLKANLSDAYLSLERNKLDKNTLESRFLNSELFHLLVKQVQSIVSYCSYLKLRTEKAEKNILEIEKMRVFELNDLQTKENEEKNKYIIERKILERESEKLKENLSQLTLDLEMMRRQGKGGDNNKLNDPRAMNSVEAEDKDFSLLQTQIMNLTIMLKKAKKKAEYEHKRCSKYEREVLNVKENNFNKLLNKYAECENISLRHKRFTKLFKHLYDVNTKYDLTMKDLLDEFVKYLKSREDKISYLEKKMGKAHKELEKEKLTSASYLTEIQTTANIYLKCQSDNENLKGEIAELNENFNKLYREKNREKQRIEGEKVYMEKELKNKTTIVQNQKNLVNDLRGKIKIQSAMINEGETNSHTKSRMLEESLSEVQEAKLSLSNMEKELIVAKHSVSTLKSQMKTITKKISNLKLKIYEKDSVLNQYTLAKESGEDIEMEDFDKNDFILARIELKRLRKLVICSLCEKNEKSIVISKCMHTFCKSCITYYLERRERKCPKCMLKIGHHDIKKLYLE